MPPNPPPCSPFFTTGGTKYCSGTRNLNLPLSNCPRLAASPETPHRTHSIRRRSTPAAAAETGSSESVTSTHAHTFPARVIPATNASATAVRPEHSGPTSSLTAPSGSPPPAGVPSELVRWGDSCPSSARIPVAWTAFRTFAAGVSAAGILCSRAASICRRRFAAEAISSPYIRPTEDGTQTRLHRLLCCLGANLLKNLAQKKFFPPATLHHLPGANTPPSAQRTPTHPLRFSHRKSLSSP